jgi:hypothetical protein
LGRAAVGGKVPDNNYRLVLVVYIEKVVDGFLKLESRYICRRKNRF